MELLTIKNESTVSTKDPIPGITVPTGEPPLPGSVSAANAAVLASGAATESKNVLGLLTDPQGKNVVFMLVLGVLFWKYGRKYFNA